MKDYSIRPMALFSQDMPRSLLTNQLGLGEVISRIAYSWYIEGPDKKIMVDTGSRAQLLRVGPWKNLATPEEKLKEFGLKPPDIDIVIVTHLHCDHIGYASIYSNAKFYLQKREYDFAYQPHPAYAHFYDTKLFEHLDLELIEGDEEIAEGVKTMFTPGHTPGGQSVLVETDKGIAGITGFCCIALNFEPPVAMHTKDNIINSGIYYDLFTCYDSMLRLRDACDIVIPNHEPEYASVDKIPRPGVVYTPDHKVR